MSDNGAMLYTQGFGSKPENIEIPHLDVRPPSVSSVNWPIGKRWIDTVARAEYVLVGLTSIGGVLQAIWQAGGNAAATTTTAGIVQLATLAELTTGTAPAGAFVPLANDVFTFVNGVVLAGATLATEAAVGLIQEATTAQAVARTDLNPGTPLAVQPKSLTAVMSSPGPIGDVVPSTGAFTALSASGLLTLTGSLTVTTGATALNLGTDAGTGAINLGTAGARVITIGNITGATSVTVNTGTGGFAVNTTGTGDIILNSADTMLLDSVGVLELNSSAGVISIGNDAVSQNINIGTAGARIITLGNSTGATSIVLNSGTGPINIGTNGIAHTVTIGNIVGATGVAINAGSTGIALTSTNSTISIASGTGAINIGVDAAQHTVTIGNITLGTAVAINTGTGGFTVTTTTTGDIILNSADTVLIDGAGVVEINSSAGVISIGNDAVSQGINIGTAGTRPIVIGNSTATTSIALNTGTGSSLNLGTNAIAHVVTIGNIIGATAVNVNTGTAGSTITTTNGIFTVITGSGNITIGNDAVAKVLTIGNLTGVSQLIMQAGSAASSLTTAGGAFTLNTGVGAIAISDDASATTINIGTGAAVVKTISIGGTGANVIAIGNTQTGGSISIGAAMTTGTVTIGSTGAGVGIATLFGGTGAQTINLANNTGIKTINIAGDAATSANVIKIGTAGATTLTLGSTNTTATTNIQAGSGGINLTGDVNLTAVATKISLNGGAATDFIGTGVLTLGTVTIANTNIAANDRIFLQRIAANGSVTLGELSYVISAGVNFVVNSLILGTPASIQTADVSSFSYIIFRQT